MISQTNQIINEAGKYGLDLNKLKAEMLVAELEGKLAFSMQDLQNIELILCRCVLRFDLSQRN